MGGAPFVSVIVGKNASNQSSAFLKMMGESRERERSLSNPVATFVHNTTQHQTIFYYDAINSYIAKYSGRNTQNFMLTLIEHTL